MNIRLKICATTIAALTLTLTSMCASAQLARKPSPYEAGTGAANPAANLAPPTAASASPAAGMAQRQGPDSLPALASRAEFDQLARVYDAGTPLAQPHVIFVIDRHAKSGKAKATRMHFIHTPRFQLHDRFLREKGLLHGDKEAVNRNYRAPDRRFILGTLSWQPQIQAFVYEFWDGDQLTPALLRTTAEQLKLTFFAPLQFKANALAQEQVARATGITPVTQAQLIGQQSYLPLNTGRAVGRLRIVANVDAVRDLQPTDIVLLREVPLALPPVAGVITERPSTMLSHVNLLAKGWGIPNAYVRHASQAFKALDGQWVVLSVASKDHQLRAATAAEREAARQTKPAAAVRASITPDFTPSQTLALASLRSAHRTHCGAKAANLGEVHAARMAGVVVPDGFCIPFGAYQRAMNAFGLPERVARMVQQPGFDTDASVRRTALAQLREAIARMPVDPSLTRDWQSRWQHQLQGAGVFVRSSASSEDLANFSGAGLYSTVPNVRGDAALVDAVRHVWASVFNFEAWEARRAAGIAQHEVVMAVLVQTAVDAQASGVMVSGDPFGDTPYSPYLTYIAAKRGIGIRVVEGKRVAEQVMYSSWSKAVQVLSQSAEDSALQLDPNGGVREVPLTGARAVLSDARIKHLAAVGDAIERRFGGQMQDIEWALTDDQRVIVLQARPFVGAPP